MTVGPLNTFELGLVYGFDTKRDCEGIAGKAAAYGSKDYCGASTAVKLNFIFKPILPPLVQSWYENEWRDCVDIVVSKAKLILTFAFAGTAPIKILSSSLTTSVDRSQS